MLQPMRLPRCRRRARPSGCPSPREARGGPGLGGTRPAPTSRRAARAPAARTRHPVAASIGRNGHHRSPANGRVFCAHPIGENHESVPSPMSPTARNTNDAPSTAPAMPFTTRVFSVICAATRATPVNTSPVSVKETPKVTDPASGSCWPSRAWATAAPTATFMAATVSVAAAVGAWLPTGKERSSSRRPDSSSPRVRLPIISTLIRATTTRPIAPA